MSEKNQVSRRIFIMGAAAATAAGCATEPGTQIATTRRPVPSLRRLGYKSPNEKLNVAGIGVGGKGSSDLRNTTSLGDNVVALCDADWRRAGGIVNDFPNARRYSDFRKMLEEVREIDAVTVSTPDHTHAVAAMMAIKMGKHVYVQKPLTYTVYEARQLTLAAREYGVATQMGNQGRSGTGVRISSELIWAGAIGNIREVHCWTNRPIWPQGANLTEPLAAEEPPESIDWDLWLGPAPYRPYNGGYAPFNWRGWWDFGTGALGDMACHVMDTANFALQLGYPDSVECLIEEGNNEQTFPSRSKIRYTFPARGAMPPVTLYWYDGGLLPDHPEDIPSDVTLGEGNNGTLFVGEKGYLTCHTYGENPRLLPADRFEDFPTPPQYIPRVPHHYLAWTYACKGGDKPASNFDYAGPFTEMVLMGNLSLKFPGQRLLWDGENMRFTNNAAANNYVHREYRAGWTL